jgi:hypothetical protein
MIALKTSPYDIEIIYVNPRKATSSREHDKVMQKRGLDKHIASAYLIALRGLKHQ